MKFRNLIIPAIASLLLVAIISKAQTPATPAAQPSQTPVMTSEEANQLFAKTRCSTCHTFDQDKLGPAYKKVSARYANPDATTKAYLKDLTPADYLFKKVRRGTVLFGPEKNKNWLTSDSGAAFSMMTPNTPDIISDEDLKKFITYILSLSQTK